jgi:hypothetical protein
MRLGSTAQSGLTVGLSPAEYRQLTQDGAHKRLFVAVNPTLTRGLVVISPTEFPGSKQTTPFRSQKTKEYPDYVRITKTAATPLADVPLFSMEDTSFVEEGGKFLVSAPPAVRMKRHVAKHQPPAVREPEPEPHSGQDRGTGYMSVAQAVEVINQAKKEMGDGMSMFVAENRLFVNLTLGRGR